MPFSGKWKAKLKKEFNIYKKKQVLSQAPVPKLQYKIQIQLNEIFFYLNI